jgi:hypothetical protein
VLSFPHNYPNKPPSARVLSPIPHPHVHGDLVCLDLLRSVYCPGPSRPSDLTCEGQVLWLTRCLVRWWVSRSCSDYASYFLSVDSGEKVLGTGWSSAYRSAFLMQRTHTHTHTHHRTRTRTRTTAHAHFSF